LEESNKPKKPKRIPSTPNFKKSKVRLSAKTPSSKLLGERTGSKEKRNKKSKVAEKKEGKAVGKSKVVWITSALFKGKDRKEWCILYKEEKGALH